MTLPKIYILTALLFFIINANNVFGQNTYTQHTPVPPPPSSPVFQVSARIDLNGDNVSETINLFTGSDKNPEYRLVVNNSFTLDNFEEETPARDFTIVDLDNSDQDLEIAVRSIGPSDMVTFHLYRLWGNELKKLGSLPGKLTFLGQGRIISTVWCGFFYINRRFYLHERSLTFMILPSKTHPVNIAATVKKPFNIFCKPEKSSVANTFYAGTKIEVVACQESKGGDKRDIMQDWFLIQGPYKIMGWARLREFYNEVEGLPWAN